MVALMGFEIVGVGIAATLLLVGIGLAWASYYTGGGGVFDTVASIDPLWKVLDSTVLRIPRKLDSARLQVERHRHVTPGHVTEALKRIAPGQVVIGGLMQGLQFPSVQGTFAATAPMLLGTYEHELTETFRRLLATRDYDLIVDVGCAEGFYAVGLARLAPNARVIACDTDPDARAFCQQMAVLNGVKDRVSVTGTVTPDKLRGIVQQARRALILSDCEGYEKELFADMRGLERHDLIIEVHDHLANGLHLISPHLRTWLSADHTVSDVQGQDDLVKARQAVTICPAVAPFDLKTQRDLIQEHRAYFAGYWMVAEAR